MTATLRSWGTTIDPALLLVVSELMTNAVRHGQGVVQLTVALDAARVRVEVHDEGDGSPAIRPPRQSGADLGGFGLNLVDAIAEDWGIDHEGGTMVWAETVREGAAPLPLPLEGLDPADDEGHGLR